MTKKDENKNKINNIRFSIKEYSVLSDEEEIMVLDGYLGYQDVLSSHGTVFTNDALLKAQKTLYNKPLIGIWDIALNDFKAHAQNIYDYKNTCVIGMVPETNSLEIVEYQGKKFQKCMIAVWKNYINPDIIEKIKTKQNIDLSIEIYVNDYIMRDDGYYQINDFRYDAICLLGTNIRPAMPGSHIEVVRFSEHMNKYDDQYNKIYFSLQNKEGEKMEEKEKVMEENKEEMATKTENKPVEKTDKSNIKDEKMENACGDKKMAEDTISYAAIVKELTSENIQLKTEAEKYSAKISELESQIAEYKKVEYASKVKELYSEYDKILDEKDINGLEEIKNKYSDFNEFHFEFSKVILEKIKTFDFSASKKEKQEKEQEKLGKFANVSTVEEKEMNIEKENSRDEIYKLANSF